MSIKIRFLLGNEKMKCLIGEEAFSGNDNNQIHCKHIVISI